MHNKKMVLVLGPSGQGKTYSLKNLVQNHGQEMAYINMDGKTNLPFKGKTNIAKFIIPNDPLDVIAGVKKMDATEGIEYIVIDTLSFYLDQLEQKHVIFSHDSQGAWGKVYAAQVKELLHFAANVSKKSWIFLSHTQEGELKNFITPTKAYAKGAVGRLGVEAYFDTVVYTRVFDDDTKEDGIGYGFQVRKTKETKGLSVKSPEGMFPTPFLDDNDILQIFAAIDNYENDEI